LPTTLALIPLASALACAAVILTLLRRPALLPIDRPNERSLHVVPVPRIGGLGMVAGVLVAFALLRASPLLALLTAGLATVSFLDDRRHLPIPVRFGAHAVAAVALALVALPDLHPLWQAFAALATMWMTNLYNFMDGSDGLAGGMALFGFAAYALGGWIGGDLVLAAISASIAAAAAAFLVFNFPPARVFMGDAGSIPLGFLAAALGIVGWRQGLWPFWFPLLVFSPFIVDASVTLGRRILRGERFWQAHKTHYYQRVVQLGWGHRDTALAEYALMAFCGAAALWSLGESQAVQFAVLGAAIVSYVAMAATVDLAWLRHLSAARTDASTR
jgi:UDP-N-acetylmuramyl pentapeptide phosphotransferase/UDP-N-acetylglucosamine-1-phosphate transferase